MNRHAAVKNATTLTAEAVARFMPKVTAMDERRNRELFGRGKHRQRPDRDAEFTQRLTTHDLGMSA